MGWLGDVLSAITAPVTTVAPKIFGNSNPIVGNVANYLTTGLISGNNPFGTIGTIPSGIGTVNSTIDEVTGNRKKRGELISTINQQNAAFNEAIKQIDERIPGNTPLPSPVAVDQTKPLESAPIAEERAVERARKRIIRPTRQGRASTILTSPLGVPGDGEAGSQSQGGKRLLGQ